MKLEEMILVTENRKGMEINYLSTFDDYLKVIVTAYSEEPEELAFAVAELLSTKEKASRWSEIYFAADKTSSARFCYNEPQLRGFLLGNLNESNEKEKIIFDTGRCAKECLFLLDAYDLKTDGHSKVSPFKYERLEHNFQTGELVRNMNGNEYRVLETLTERNILFQAILTGEIIVGIDTQYLAKIPKGDEVPNDCRIQGVEWGYGFYLGNSISKIDFDVIRREYGKPEKINTLEDYRSSLKRKFSFYKKLMEDTGLNEAIKEAVTSSIYEEFDTAKEGFFLEKLGNGYYDSGFQEKENTFSLPKKEKSR